MALPAVKLHLILSKTYFQPGDAVSATIQIANNAEFGSPNDTLVKELSFQASGSERVEPSWIVQLYRPDTPSTKDGSRRVIRNIFATEPVTLAKNTTLVPASAQNFIVRFRLPAALPPTFKGSSIRFSYTVDVRATYEVPSGGLLPALFETTATTSLLVWPPLPTPPRPMQSGMERRPSLVPRGSAHGTTGQMSPSSSSQLPASFSMPTSPPMLRGGSASSSSGGIGPAAAAAAAAAAVPGGSDELEAPLVAYKLNMLRCKVRWQEVSAGAGPPGSRQVCPTAPPTAPPTPQHRASAAGEDVLAVPCRTSASTLTPGASMQPLQPLPAPSHLLPAASPQLAHHQRGTETPSSAGRGPPAAEQLLAALALNSDDDDTLTDSWDAGWSGELGRQANGGQDAADGSPPHHGGRGSSAVMGPSNSFVMPRRPPQFGRSYVLNVGEGQTVIKILLQAPLQGPLQLGSTFGGVLDFRGRVSAGGLSPACCHQVVIMLETEEIVSADCRPSSSRRAAASSPGGGAAIRKLFCEHQEMTTDSVLSQFQFTVPAAATPSFRTPMVALRWVLRFELSVGARLRFTGAAGAARPPQLQQLVWSLPLVVQAPVVAVR